MKTLENLNKQYHKVRNIYLIVNFIFGKKAKLTKKLKAKQLRKGFDWLNAKRLIEAAEKFEAAI